MCERCVEQAVINSNNAQALLSLANAASSLAISVPGSEAAVQAIIARIESIAAMPKAEEAEPEPANGDEGKHDAHAKAIQLLRSLGINLYTFPIGKV